MLNIFTVLLLISAHVFQVFCATSQNVTKFVFSKFKLRKKKWPLCSPVLPAVTTVTTPLAAAWQTMPKSDVEVFVTLEWESGVGTNQVCLGPDCRGRGAGVLEAVVGRAWGIRLGTVPE